MDQLPIFFNVKDRWVAVIGGGTAASRKAEMAMRAGARVKVFAGQLCEEFHPIKANAHFGHVPREPLAQDLEGCTLLYSACEDVEQNRKAHALAKAARVPCNVVDMPELCDFTMPSIVDRSPVVIAVSTAGTSPILGRMIKARLETMLPAAYGQVAAFVGRYRKKVGRALKDFQERRRFWERILDGPVVDLVLAGHKAEAVAEFDAQLEAAARGAEHRQQGEVYLVGAGPGDPDLLTFKALRLMQRADVVLYDRLIGDGILNLVRRDAERIYVGKQPQDHTVPQHEISQMLLRLAREGKRVLRLKGGDPFVFGRGGEEIELLAEAGIPSGGAGHYGRVRLLGLCGNPLDPPRSCPGLHLRHRPQQGRTARPRLEDAAAAAPNGGCLYGSRAPRRAHHRAFIEKGAAPSLPVALIANGTRPNQKVLIGTLDTIAEKAAKASVKGPAILIVGSVVRMREKLDWYVPEDQARDAKPSMTGTPAPASAAE
jgi:uroporphyrin-III C-methyltransferase/precorrin-2 dehydrogenase/sirohydrochlorin ferrochelatase